MVQLKKRKKLFDDSDSEQDEVVESYQGKNEQDRHFSDDQKEESDQEDEVPKSGVVKKFFYKEEP